MRALWTSGLPCVVNFALGVSPLKVIKTASTGASLAGDTVTFTMKVENIGIETLTNVSISEDILERSDGTSLSLTSGPTFVSNSGSSPQGTLAPNETATFTATYVLTQADIDAGGLSNQAVGVGTSPTVGEMSAYSRSAVDAEEQPTNVPIPHTPRIGLEKTGTPFDANGNGFIDAGDHVNYSFTVTNAGNVTVSNITVSDPGVTVTGGPLASLAPGSSDDTTFSATHVLTQADIDAGERSNTASVTGSAPGGSSVSDQASITVTFESIRRISLEKSATHVDANGNNAMDAGETVSYAFAIENTGNVTLTNVTLTDPNVTVLGGPIASLAPGVEDSTTFTATHVLTQAEVDAGGVSNTATVTGNAPDGTPVSDMASVTVASHGSEKISLEKLGSYQDTNGNGVTDVGDHIGYSFTVENTGTVTITGIMVTDTQASVFGGPIASLAPGATDTTTFTAIHALTQADIDAGMVANMAEATGSAPDGDPVGDGASATNLLQATEKITLSKAGTYQDTNGNGIADVGDTIAYSFAVANTGNVTLSDVTVTDPLLAVSGGPLSSLAPGGADITTFTGSYALTQSDIDAGKVVNEAMASGRAPDGGMASDPSSATVTLTRRPALTLTKTGSYEDTNGNGITDVGDRVAYGFAVANTGNVTLSNITLADPLVQLSGGPLADLAPGASDTTTFTASYLLTQADIDAGSFSNVAEASGSAPDGTAVSDTSNAVVPLTRSPSISLTKTGSYQDTNGNGVADVGDHVGYAFTIENTGNVTLTSITMDDPLVTVAGGPLASLAPGAADGGTFSASYALTQADIDAGRVENTAEAKSSAGDNGSPVSSTANAMVPLARSPSIGLTKTGTYQDTNGNGLADVGDHIGYAFTVTNLGNVTLTDIRVTDLQAPVSGGPLAGLAPGTSDTASFVAHYPLTQAEIDAGEVVNAADAVGTGPDGATVNASANATVPLSVTPDALLIKRAMLNDMNGNGFADAGETVDYTFTIDNTGNVTLTDITIEDSLTVVSGGPLASLAPGARDSGTFTASYTISQSDIDAGKVENIATLKASGPNGDTLERSSQTEQGPGPTVITLEPRADIQLFLTGTLTDPDGDGFPSPGDAVTYAFKMRNTGNVTLTGIIIASLDVTGMDIVVPAGLRVNAAVPVSGGSIASLAPGAEDTGTFTASYPLTAADIEAGAIVATALVVGTGADGTAVSDVSDDPADLTDVDVEGDGEPDDPTVTLLPQRLSLALEKAGAFQGTAGQLAEAGDTILYTFTVVNDGNVPASEVKPVDAGPRFDGKAGTGSLSGFAPASASLEPGQSQVFTATYTLSEQDIANAQGVEDGITNTAIAEGTGLKGRRAVSPEASA
ncbi:beta strand repeat-containing protein, partial [Nitratireductor sp. ZSWI3]|uniref:beta strand repeat-containing protein n=1 Tax=Nitratireductor sp. ZSWI3 TaxID=2966359 RepID=UPI0035B463A1|nr:hypothetical protein [Nitratireductor sp. ZSWI3]